MTSTCRVIFVVLLSFPALAQVSIRTATSPTEYSDCAAIQEFNGKVRSEVFEAVKECESREMARWKPDYSVCSVGGVSVGTTQGCIGSLNNWCRVSNATEEADRNCRETVRRWKEMQKLTTAADEREIASDEMRSLLHLLATGGARATRLMRPGIAAKLARSQIERMGTIGDNVLAQLDAALRAADGYSGPPSSAQLDRLYSNSAHPLVRLSRATTKKNIPPAEVGRLIQVAKRYALSGDPLAAKLVGDATSAGMADFNASNAPSWYARSAALGSAAASAELGRYFHEQGDIEAAESWYRVAVEMGSPVAMGTLAEILWRKGDTVGARELAGRLERRGHPRARTLSFLSEMKVALPPVSAGRASSVPLTMTLPPATSPRNASPLPAVVDRTRVPDRTYICTVWVKSPGESSWRKPDRPESDPRPGFLRDGKLYWNKDDYYPVWDSVDLSFRLVYGENRIGTWHVVVTPTTIDGYRQGHSSKYDASGNFLRHEFVDYRYSCTLAARSP
ncbi:MAG: hypothetical protein M3P06_05390 [Acidobacteriota bacterium]|nr:hypothetical protein [Acidobacteriota bacterium]